MKKQKKLFERYIHVDVYSVDVVLIIGSQELVIPYIKNPMNISEDKQDKLLSTVSRSFEKQGAFGHTWFTPGGGSLIWLKDFSPSVFVHEITHAAYHILYTKGITLCDETDEVYAYLVEYLWRSLNPFSFQIKK